MQWEQLDAQLAGWQRRMRLALERALLRPTTHLDTLPYLKAAQAATIPAAEHGLISVVLAAVPACSTGGAHVRVSVTARSRDDAARALRGCYLFEPQSLA